ncbi:MAG: ATP-binding protein [Candidatus Eremiobacteraeota bacterium]|nr:ATP-binding protein [Candidatus Eremiobacteraeota bacterium]
MAIVWKVEDNAERVLSKRRAFRECLASIAGPPAGVDAAELIYGELVANTVRYANGEVEVRLELVDSKPPVLVVRDHGPGLRRGAGTLRRELFAESGRGLGIVELLAREVDIDPAEGGGTVIRAVLPVTPRKRAA